MMHVRVNVPPVPSLLQAMAEGLVLVDIALMQHADERGVPLPPLYESGIVYRREPIGREWWETAADLLDVVSDRSGDCEDLVCYRVAELRYFDGEPARVHIIPTPRGSFHCLVLRGDGETIEDPSRELLAQESERMGVPMRELARRFTTDRRNA